MRRRIRRMRIRSIMDVMMGMLRKAFSMLGMLDWWNNWFIRIGRRWGGRISVKRIS